MGLSNDGHDSYTPRKTWLAIDILLMDSPKNEYLPNGHNRQGDRADLPLYLPGNGGLLFAIAMMTAGWDGCEDEDARRLSERWKLGGKMGRLISNSIDENVYDCSANSKVRFFQ